MSSFFSKIGEAFTSLETFMANLFTSVKKEYLNLEPEAQLLFTNIIKWGNLIKGYIANPTTLTGIGGFLIQEAEQLIGTTYVNLINSVLSEVLLDLGIIQEALVNPADAWEALVKHLQTFSGSAIGKEILKIGGSIAETLSGLGSNEVVMIIAFVYKTFFQGVTTPVIPTPAQAESGTALPTPIQPIAPTADFPVQQPPATSESI